MQFWQGDGSGSPVDGFYNNWRTTEPNDLNGEDFGHMFPAGDWNDYAFDNSLIEGYVVEFGGLEECTSNFSASGVLTVSLSQECQPTGDGDCDDIDIVTTDDTTTACPEEAIVIDGATLLANDMATNGAPLIIQDLFLDNTDQGILVNNEDSTWTLTPGADFNGCLLYTSPSPRDQRGSRMPSSA